MPRRARHERDADLQQLRANDPNRPSVAWINSAITDADVAQLSAALVNEDSRPNTACLSVQLSHNRGITDACIPGLQVALTKGGVVAVRLTGTLVGNASQAALRAVWVANAVRRVAGNAKEVTNLPWFCCGVEDAEVEQLAGALALAKLSEGLNGYDTALTIIDLQVPPCSSAAGHQMQALN